jgi:hypothetical protein
MVMTMRRSWDGLTLYAVSSDGTLAAFCFDAEELEGIAPHAVQQQYLQKFGFTLPPLPEGWSHTSFPVASSGQRMTPPPSPNRPSHQTHGLNGFGAPSTSNGHEVVNTLIAKRNTKRRVQLQSLGRCGGLVSPAVLANSSSFHDSLSPAHRVSLHSPSDTSPVSDDGSLFTRIAAVERKQEQFDARIAAVERKQEQFDARITVERKQEQFDARVAAVERKQEQFDARIAAVERKQEQFEKWMGGIDKKLNSGQ